MVYSRNWHKVSEAAVNRRRGTWGQKSLKKRGIRPCKAFENCGLYPKVSGKPLMSFSEVTGSRLWFKMVRLSGVWRTDWRVQMGDLRDGCLRNPRGRPWWLGSRGGDLEKWRNLRESEKVKIVGIDWLDAESEEDKAFQDFHSDLLVSKDGTFNHCPLSIQLFRIKFN